MDIVMLQWFQCISSNIAPLNRGCRLQLIENFSSLYTFSPYWLASASSVLTDKPIFLYLFSFIFIYPLVFFFFSVFVYFKIQCFAKLSNAHKMLKRWKFFFHFIVLPLVLLIVFLVEVFLFYCQRKPFGSSPALVQLEKKLSWLLFNFDKKRK